MIPSVLDKIVEIKRIRVEESKKAVPMVMLEHSLRKQKRIPRNFTKALTHGDGVCLIAEIKKASPSRGILREDFNALQIAQLYEDEGVAAISVLTEADHFMGRPSHLATVREVTTRPILRKDFLIDEYQIAESAVLGCDAALLITAILTDENLKSFISQLRKFNIDALVEVHTEEELDRALNQGASIIGINNRNLKTMQIDLSTTERLMKRVSKQTIVVAESGIDTYEQIRKLMDCGVRAFLIGTSILIAKDMKEKIRQLRGVRK